MHDSLYGSTMHITKAVNLSLLFWVYPDNVLSIFLLSMVLTWKKKAVVKVLVEAFYPHLQASWHLFTSRERNFIFCSVTWHRKGSGNLGTRLNNIILNKINNCGLIMVMTGKDEDNNWVSVLMFKPYNTNSEEIWLESVWECDSQVTNQCWRWYAPVQGLPLTSLDNSIESQDWTSVIILIWFISSYHYGMGWVSGWAVWCGKVTTITGNHENIRWGYNISTQSTPTHVG